MKTISYEERGRGDCEGTWFVTQVGNDTVKRRTGVCRDGVTIYGTTYGQGLGLHAGKSCATWGRWNQEQLQRVEHRIVRAKATHVYEMQEEKGSILGKLAPHGVKRPSARRSMILSRARGCTERNMETASKYVGEKAGTAAKSGQLTSETDTYGGRPP